MSVYVDTYRAPYGRYIMCHMVGDTHEELMEMAGQLGLRPYWIQDEGTYKEHFDIAQSKKKQAIELGAVEVSSKKLVRIINAKRGVMIP